LIRIERPDPDGWADRMEGRNITPLLSRAFLEALRSERLEPIYLLLYDGDDLVGGISGLVDYGKNRWNQVLKLFKNVTLYSSHHPIRQDLNVIGDLTSYFQSRGYSRIVNMGYDHAVKMGPKPDGFHYYRNEELVVDLDRSWEIIESSMKRDMKRKMKKAQKADLAWGMSDDPEMVEVLFEMMEGTKEARESRGYHHFIRQYIPLVTKEVMKEQIRTGASCLSYLKQEDEIVCIKFYTRKGERAFAMYIGTSAKGYELGANALIYLRDMEHLHRTGCKVLNLGGLPKEGREGLRRFKEGLGADPTFSWSFVSPILLKGFKRFVFDLNKKLQGSSDEDIPESSGEEHHGD